MRRSFLLLAPILAGCAAERAPRPEPPPASPVLPTQDGGAIAGALVLTHGGAGTLPELADGPRAAAARGLAVLQAGGSVLEAAIEGTVHMEDDPRLNAGTGSNIRLDGFTVQMDASLMVSDGTFAAVAVIERVKNPIRAAQLVLDTPHLLLAGEGATRFAHRMGLPDESPVAPEAVEKYRERMRKLRERAPAMDAPGPGSDEDGRDAHGAPRHDLPGELPEELRGGDTVGTVARDAEGRFAATLSTGGTSLALMGRVGDVPVHGAGLFAGPAGAVACTGEGEVIMRQLLARAVYEALASGVSAAEAVARAVAAFPEGAAVGIIAVDRRGWGVAADRPMAFGLAR